MPPCGRWEAPRRRLRGWGAVMVAAVAVYGLLGVCGGRGRALKGMGMGMAWANGKLPWPLPGEKEKGKR